MKSNRQEYVPGKWKVSLPAPEMDLKWNRAETHNYYAWLYSKCKN